MQKFSKGKAIAAVVTAAALAGGATAIALTSGGNGPDPEPTVAGPIAVISTDFESGLDGWGPRDNGSGAPTIAVSTAAAVSGSSSALVSDRTSQGSGIGRVVTGDLKPGVTYDITAQLRFAEGEAPGAIWLTLQRTNDGADSYDTLAQFAGITNDGWTEVTASFTPAEFGEAFIYFETAYTGTNTSSFYVDDIVVLEPPAAEFDATLTPIRDTVSFPVGVAIDSRETAGGAAGLLTHHFGQVTPENHMKPEAWYDANGEFSPHPDADAIMTFAQQNDLTVYGHVLVWHSQTPDWFFQDDTGRELTNSAADQEILRARMHDHIFAIAQYLADEYGLFGSDSNPLVAWDVVNEVISDGAGTPGGLRESRWFDVLGEDFIDLAFEYADEAFNDVYADAGTERPVKLFINEYNTEQAAKRERYLALAERLLGRGVPLDGVGHQFHLNIYTPTSSLEAALADTQRLGVLQAVTEMDVTTGTPVTDMRLTEQGYYYRDAFNVFRAYQDDLFSVTLWGLTDSRSWRSGDGDPLAFDGNLDAKQAYYGIIGGEDLDGLIRDINAAAGSVEVAPGAAADASWGFAPEQAIAGGSSLRLLWVEDRLTARVGVTDSTVDPAADGVSFYLAGETYWVAADGSGDVPAVVEQRADGYDLVASLPLTRAEAGKTEGLDVTITDGADEYRWNTADGVGYLTMLAPPIFTEVPAAAAAPVIDGQRDAAWDEATVVTTDVQVEGAGGATGDVSLMWLDNTLYVYAHVTDAVIDVSGTDAWIQDSIELYVDLGNAKSGVYRPRDMQARISAENVATFGIGDPAAQAARIESATAVVDDGYVVEVAIDLLGLGGAGAVHGFDVQVNDGQDGARMGVRNWADPTGQSFQNTERWGVIQLVV